MKTAILIFLIGLFLALAGLVYVGSNQTSEGPSRLEWKILSEAEPMFVHAGAYRHPFFFDKENGIAVTGLSIEKTSDGGKTWASVRDWPEMTFYGSDLYRE